MLPKKLTWKLAVAVSTAKSPPWAPVCSPLTEPFFTCLVKSKVQGGQPSCSFSPPKPSHVNPPRERGRQAGHGQTQDFQVSEQVTPAPLAHSGHRASPHPTQASPLDGGAVPGAGMGLGQWARSEAAADGVSISSNLDHPTPQHLSGAF